MIIYIDVAMLISFLQNSCLLLVAGISMKEKLKFGRIVLGGLIGAVYQLICILYPIKSLFLSVLVAFLQITAVYDSNRVKLTFVYIMAAIITAGIMYALGSVQVTFVLGVVVIPAAAIYMRRILKISTLNRTIEIRCGNNSIKEIGFVDSGNELNTVIIGKSHALKLFGKERTNSLLSFREGGVIQCKTVKGTSVIPFFIADALEVEGVSFNTKIGVINENLPYIILPVEFLEGDDANVKKTGAETKEFIL